MKSKERIIEKLISDLRQELSNLQYERNIKEYNKLIGKCYVSQDSHSDGKIWYIFHKVLRTDGVGLSLFSFQVDTRGVFKVESERYLYGMAMLSRYREIPNKTFDKEFGIFCDDLRGLYSSIAGLKCVE